MFPKIVFILMTILAAGVFAFPACADPILLQETGRLTSYGTNHGVVNQITIDDAYIYVSLDGGGFEIRDRVTGAQLSTTRVATDAYAVQFVVRDNYAYISDWYGGLTVLGLTDRSNPIHAASWRDWPHNGEFAWGIAIDGNDCFLSINQYGIVTLDISDPYNPAQTGFLAEPQVSGASVLLANAFLLNEPDRLLVGSYRQAMVFDKSDPDNLSMVTSVSSYPATGMNYDAAEDQMYLGYGYLNERMFRVYDMDDPDAPVLLSTYNEALPSGESHMIRGIAKHGNYVFAIDVYREVAVLDYSDPDNPQRVASFPKPGDVSDFGYSIAFDGDTAYVGTRGSGVIMLDISPLTVIPEPAAILMPLFMFLSGASLLVKRLRR